MDPINVGRTCSCVISKCPKGFMKGGQFLEQLGEK